MFSFLYITFFPERQYFSFLEKRCLFIQVYIFCMFTSFCIVSIFYLSLFLFIYLFVYLCFFIWWFVLRKSIFPYFRGNSLNSREGVLWAPKCLHFWHFISAKDTKPCSFQNQTLLLLQQKQPLCILNSSPNVLHRYIVSAKANMNNRRKFRSQTSDNMERWKAEQGRGREKRKIRREKIRIERVRRQKIQMREKVGKPRNTVFFQWFVAPEGRKVGSLKRRVRSQLATGAMKNCTPLWCEAHF